ncbi:MAG: ribosomal protein S18-alanine N-acetyltransferase, partial [Lachnospiraceae bacterium]|nr:ribosomal protein S18-alanine N-acetyltransferase [Lachnospiraceae bacterium]
MVHALEQKVFKEDAWKMEDFEIALSNDNYIFYVDLVDKIEADDEDEIRGYLILIHTTYEAEILNICIDEDYRQRGAGYKLISYGIENLGDACDTVFLEVREGNLPAQKLYKKMNFEETRIITNYYRNPVENAISM